MNLSILDLFWIFLIVTALSPVLRNARIDRARFRLIREMERRRNSRLITLIHRQETINLLGIPLARHIDVEDSEQVLRAIRLTPPDMPIDLILHTPGGLVLAAEQIARALRKHPARVTVFVPHYAMSGGTLIALAADEIVLDANAVLGPVDPQIGQFPAISILRAVSRKNPDRVDDNTLIMADIAAKAMTQVERTVYDILADRLGEEKARELAETLSEGRWTHDYPLTLEALRELGLQVTDTMPREIYQLMQLYPQPSPRRPSVQFIPVPYRQDRPGEER